MSKKNYCSGKKNGIEVKLILAPYLDKPNGVGIALKKIEENTGIKVWDYSDAFKNMEFFADSLHTNYEGALELQNLFDKDGLMRELTTTRIIVTQ